MTKSKRSLWWAWVGFFMVLGGLYMVWPPLALISFGSLLFITGGTNYQKLKGSPGDAEAEL